MSEALFINVEVDDPVAGDPELAAKLAEVCPVDIFAQPTTARCGSSRRTSTSASCASCASTPRRPGTVRVIKLYSGETLPA